MKFITPTYLSSLAAAMVMSLSFAACDSDKFIVPDELSEGDGSGVYLDLTINVPTTETETRTASSESSEEYNKGLSGESKVNTIYIYMFKDDGTPVSLDGTHKYYKKSSPTTKYSSIVDEESGNSDTGLGVGYNTGQLLLKNIVLNKTYHLYVLCNHRLMGTESNSSGEYEDLDFANEDEFINSQQTMAAIMADGGYASNVPMSSRSYSGEIYKEVTFTTANQKSTGAKTISIYVERSLARIAFMNTSKSFSLYKDTNFSSQFGTSTINIVSREVLNNPPGWYTFRHVGSINSSYTTSMASDFTRFGKITTQYPYVITPYTSQQTRTAGCYKDNASPIVIVPQSGYYSKYKHLFDWLEWNESANGFEAYTSSNGGVIGMFPENCMSAIGQTRGSATAVILRGQLVLSGTDKTTGKSVLADPENCEYGTTNGYYYISYHNPYADEYKKISNTQYQFSYYYYNGRFYACVSSIKSDYPSAMSGLTKTNYQSYGIRKFKYGFGYYLLYVRHYNNNNSNVMGAMEYSLVRNNTYNITINKVALPPYTDDEIGNLTTTDMIQDVETAETFINATTTLSSMSVNTSEIPIGE